MDAIIHAINIGVLTNPWVAGSVFTACIALIVSGLRDARRQVPPDWRRS